jgi:hypothetical protein
MLMSVPPMSPLNKSNQHKVEILTCVYFAVGLNREATPEG